ncbi:MAG TPA: glycosyltransferase family 9 protein [Candidatus Acidoferrales bacterium]|nr:glycosyltransferase family 9 protein [Candidatus Acidoferrales bacterium]
MNRNDFALLLPALPQRAEILILRPRSLGDIILETPAIAALHAWRPDLRICVLVEPRFAAALEGNPAISEVLFSADFAPTIAAIRRHRFPIVFNQHGGPRSAWLAAASGARHRVCWRRFQFSFLYNARVPDAAEFYGTPFVHTVEHRISQFYAAGLPRGPIPRAQVLPQLSAIESAARILAVCGIQPGQDYAVLQPGARLPGMRWPVSGFAAVARWLREARGIASVVNLSARDAAIAEDVRRELTGVASMPAPPTVPELIALISRARLFIGNDSGPVHIAAATGCPSVVVYGVTNPAQWRPWQAEHRAIHTGARFRAPRGDKHILLSETRPISAISVDEVCEACEDLLSAPVGRN